MLVAQPIAPGTELGGYRIESVLGEGGMGVVYLATQAVLDRHVALKILSPELADDEEFRLRFIRESNAAAALDDPNILPIYDAGEADGHLYIAMRRVDGADLGRILDERGRLAPQHVLSIVEQIGGALDAAHQTGLVHRDVKPANILVDRNGIAFLCDFGLAKRGAVDDVTRAGVFMGTVDYCSPEQITGGDTDGRTDVYALGAVAYHALTGRPPFLRESETATASAHLDEPLPAASRAHRDIPAGLDRVLGTAMAKRPADRYATTAALAEAFAAALGGQRVTTEDSGAGLADVAEPARRQSPGPPVEDGGRLTEDVLQAKLEQGRGPLWKRSSPWRLMTRVFRTLGPREAGRLTHTVLRERLDAGRGPVRWREVRNPAPPTRMHEAPRTGDGRLTAELLQAKVEEEKARRAGGHG